MKVNYEELIVKEVFEFDPEDKRLKADWVYTEEYYTVSRGVISRIVEKHNLAFIRGVPWPLTDLLRYIKPNKNGYTLDSEVEPS